MRRITAPVLLLAVACGQPVPTAADTSPTVTVTPTPPTEPEDTDPPEPDWLAAITPPTEVDADCWTWSVTWDDATGEPVGMTRSARC